MAYSGAGSAPPPIQDALRQPEKWNSEWEAFTKTIERVSPSDQVHSAVVQLAMAPQGTDWCFIEYQSLITHLCHVQAWVTRDALSYFATKDLEAKWMSASSKLRREHLLIGLSNACSIAKNLHDARVYCGQELKLVHLAKHGRVFLDLLKTVMVEGALEVPKEPRYVPHPAWDAFGEAQKRATPTDHEKLALARILVLRTKLICHIVHFTLRSFVGEEFPEVSVEKNHKRKTRTDPTSPDEALAAAFMEQTLGRAGARAAMKDDKKAYKDRQSRGKVHCSSIACVKRDSGDEKYPRCGKCWEQMKREVLYCSVECQKADWKLYHKKICGKPLTFDAVAKPVLAPPKASSAVPVVGPPVGGYKRAPMLNLQIAVLTQYPNKDYIITPGAADKRVEIDFPDPEAHALFRACREKAMTTGDRQSIATMAHFLCWMTLGDAGCVSKGATANRIVAQLRKEYEFDDLHLAVREMQQRQNRDPLRRPMLLCRMSPEDWVKFAKGMNVNRQVVLDS